MAATRSESVGAARRPPRARRDSAAPPRAALPERGARLAPEALALQAGLPIRGEIPKTPDYVLLVQLNTDYDDRIAV